MFVNSAARIPSISSLLSNGEVEIAEIRRRNLDVLEAEAESLEAIGDAMRAKDPTQTGGDLPNYANYLSQVRGGTRNMGTRFARKLEAGMGKPKGWMDVAQFEAAELSLEGKEAGQIITGMDTAERAQWMKMLRLANEANPKKSAASPFGPIPRGGEPTAETTKRAPKPKRRRKGGRQ